jgi:hypothetical protein
MVLRTRWPSYLKGTLDDVTALGVVALNYSELEVTFHRLSAVISGVDAAHVAKFHEIKNTGRVQAIKNAISKSNLPDKLKDYAGYFVQCYEQCARNRNEMMHSRIGGEHIDAVSGNKGFIFSKYSRSGEQLFSTGLDDLHMIADQIHEITGFGNTVAFFVSQFWRHRKNSTSLLKEKPAFPAALHWQSLPTPKK